MTNDEEMDMDTEEADLEMDEPSPKPAKRSHKPVTIETAPRGEKRTHTEETGVLMSSKILNWRTPREVFEELGARFGDQREGRERFALDAAAEEDNALSAKYWTQETNGLVQSWDTDGGVAFVNPPYGRGIGHWITKGIEEAKCGNASCFLIAARTETAWFQLAMRHARVYLLEGRIFFLSPDGEKKSAATFPSAVLVFGPDVIPGIFPLSLSSNRSEKSRRK